MKATAIIAAGGAGTRIKSAIPKQFLPIAGRPMIFHTLRAFERAQTIDRVVVVLSKSDLPRLNPSELAHHDIRKVVNVVPGGTRRQDSVACGLEAVSGSPVLVAIHDAARCLIAPDVIDRTVEACEGWDGAVAALPVRDTMKRVEGERILATEPRDTLWAMQTPQVFRLIFIRDAYRKALAEGFPATDDAAVAERSGGRIRVVEGSTRNFKVTLDEDLKLAETLLKAGL